MPAEHHQDVTFDGHVVPHTHWDRAWYLPFSGFRARLILFVKNLLNALEDHKNPNFRFTLDGQTVLLDDFLDICPEDTERMRAHVASGRLEVGPWFTLPDLFIPHPEALIRNLHYGRKRAQALGAALNVGYVPDPFGHCAQMPQILAGFGMQTYVFARGLSFDVKQKCGLNFIWKAPDGSSVAAACQPLGYDAAGALGYPQAFGRFEHMKPNLVLARERLRRIFVEATEHGPAENPAPVLISNGCDHMPAQPDIACILEQVGQHFPGVRLHVSGLAGFDRALTAHRSAVALPEHTGDLVGNVDHPVLAHVFSTRTYLKQANHAAECALLTHVEPLLALGRRLGCSFEHQGLLSAAWRNLLLNHAHDNICGCSIDSVHREDEIRFAQVLEQAAELNLIQLESLVAGRALVSQSVAQTIALQEEATSRSGKADTGEAQEALTREMAQLLLVNPHPWPVQLAQTVDIFLPFAKGRESDRPAPYDVVPHALRDLQDIPCNESWTLWVRTARGDEKKLQVVAAKSPCIQAQYLNFVWGVKAKIRVEHTIGGLGYEVLDVFARRNAPIVDQVQPRTRGGGELSVSLRETTEQSTARGETGLFCAEGPGGFRSETPMVCLSWTSPGDGMLIELAARPGEHQISVGMGANKVTLVNPMRFEVERDHGDTYTASLPPLSLLSPLPAELVGAALRENQPGVMDLTFRLPQLSGSCPRAGSDEADEADEADEQDQKDEEDKAHHQLLRVSVERGPENGIRFAIQYTNQLPNIRLRVLWGLLPETKGFWSDHPLLVKEWSLEPDLERKKRLSAQWPSPKQPYPGEGLYATEYRGRFSIFAADSCYMWLATRGLCETELINREGQMRMALTLHRSVGRLSVSGGSIRSCHAGPSLETPEAQCMRSFSHVIDLGFGWELQARRECPLRGIEQAVAATFPPFIGQLPEIPGVSRSGVQADQGAGLASVRGLPSARAGNFGFSLGDGVQVTALKPHESLENALVLHLLHLRPHAADVPLYLSDSTARVHTANLSEAEAGQEISSSPAAEGGRLASLHFRPFELKVVFVEWMSPTDSAVRSDGSARLKSQDEETHL